jgi:hypothetical protein
MFELLIEPGLFEGNDILYNIDNDPGIRSSVFPEYIGSGIMDTIIALAPLASKAFGTWSDRSKANRESAEKEKERDFLREIVQKKIN